MKLIYLLFLVLPLLAQDEERQSSRGLGTAISTDLREGHFLIYNCKKSFFACVDTYSFDLCKERRAKAIEDNVSKLNCVPIKEMKNFDSCKEEHYRRMSTIVHKGFCFRVKENILRD